MAVYIHLLKIVFAFEWKNWVLRPAFLGACASLVVLFGYALYNGQQLADSHRAQIGQALEAEQSFYEGKKLLLDSIGRGLKSEDAWYKHPANPIAMSSFRGAGRHAYKLPSELALLAVGQSDIYPYYTKIVTTAKVEVGSLQNPYHQASGPFDLAFVLVVLLPLLVIAFTYNLLSSEREQGTLPLLLSQPVSVAQVLGAKLLVRFGWLAGANVALLLAGLGLFGAIGNPLLPALLLGVVAYLAFWFLLALWVNLQGKSSGFNAIALLGAWLLLALIVPNVANLLAQTAYPVPSRVEMINAARAAEQQAERQKDSILTAYYAANLQYSRKPEGQQDWQDNWRESFALADFEESLNASTIARYESAIRQQQQLAAVFRFLSPAVTFQHFLVDLAQNNTSHFYEFEQQVTAYQRTWAGFFKEKFLNNEDLTLADYDRMPVFESQKSLHISFADAVALLGFIFVASVGVYQRVKKGREWFSYA